MYLVGWWVMANNSTTEKVIPYTLLGMTAVTGLVDAVSFLSLGRIFTANMTGISCFSRLQQRTCPACPSRAR
jgi:uncharacterized protein DUF1275